MPSNFNKLVGPASLAGPEEWRAEPAPDLIRGTPAATRGRSKRRPYFSPRQAPAWECVPEALPPQPT